METPQSIGLITVWRIVIGLAIAVMAIALPFTPTFPYAKEVLPNYGARALTTYAHFDGVHYLTIISRGYEGTGLIQAFFPAYPMVIKLLSFGRFNPIVVGTIISTASLFISGYLLVKLAGSLKPLWLLLLFPTAFFFTALYTESFFLMLTLMVFYSIKTKNWTVFTLAGILAGLTRLQGVLLVIPLFMLLPKSKRSLSLAPLLGLVVYMSYLSLTFHNPLLFLTVQKEFGAERSSGTLIPLITPLFRYAKMLLTVPVLSWTYYTVLQELLTFLGGLYLSYLLWRKHKAYGAYAFASLLLPSLTGTLSSMPRYVLVVFPLFIVLAKQLSPRIFNLLLLIFAILLAINLALFTQGRWVA